MHQSSSKAASGRRLLFSQPFLANYRVAQYEKGSIATAITIKRLNNNLVRQAKQFQVVTSSASRAQPYAVSNGNCARAEWMRFVPWDRRCDFDGIWDSSGSLQIQRIACSGSRSEFYRSLPNRLSPLLPINSSDLLSGLAHWADNGLLNVGALSLGFRWLSMSSHWGLGGLSLISPLTHIGLSPGAISVSPSATVSKLKGALFIVNYVSENYVSLNPSSICLSSHESC